MLGNLGQKLKGLAKDRCHTCGEIIDGKGIKAEVKVPTYTGTHEKSFCCKQHLKEWREKVKEWEKENHEIPTNNKGPTCVNCMR